MNERIKAIASEAREFSKSYIEHCKHYGYCTEPDAYERRFEEKFAELVMQECIGVVKGGRFLHDRAPAALFATECSAAIKRHFELE